MRAVQGANQPELVTVRMLDIVTLLHNVLAGARTSNVGFEDANETLTSLTRKLEVRQVPVDRRVLESALWSCNLMNEAGKFWDGQERSFDELLKSILGDARRFDKTFNFIRQEISK